MTVAVVTPWHNHLELADAYMAAMNAGPYPDELIVVDNGSNPPLTFAQIRLDYNAGFCTGSNAGLNAATADMVAFVNNDVQLGAADWLRELVAGVEPGVLVGAQMRMDAHAWVDGLSVPYLDGWCLAGTRDDLLELGGFNEMLREPAYYSDNLLCLEARAAGMTLREVPIPLEHLGGRTSEPSSNLLVRPATLANKQVYVDRARQLLHQPSPEAVGVTA